MKITPYKIILSISSVDCITNEAVVGATNKKLIGRPHKHKVERYRYVISGNTLLPVVLQGTILGKKESLGDTNCPENVTEGTGRSFEETQNLARHGEKQSCVLLHSEPTTTLGVMLMITKYN